ncbi:RICIN domain-containing protein, partial [Streptomyces sp. BE303]|uniref:RICIN domain-containing protein n=1 Tax=Streptomyces sp. BE303 TaxID=3002528 RepID=UPI003FA6D8D6
AAGAAGSTIVQRACNGQTAQRWKITPANFDRYTNTSAASPHALTLATASLGDKATQEIDTGSELQRSSIDGPAARGHQPAPAPDPPVLPSGAGPGRARFLSG